MKLDTNGNPMLRKTTAGEGAAFAPALSGY
jgi:hypothetical protein